MKKIKKFFLRIFKFIKSCFRKKSVIHQTHSDDEFYNKISNDREFRKKLRKAGRERNFVYHLDKRSMTETEKFFYAKKPNLQYWYDKLGSAFIEGTELLKNLKS